MKAMSTFARALSFVANCVPLKLVTPWQGSCFGHAFNKTCQYVCNDTNVYIDFWEVNLKATQHTVQKTIIWS